MNKVCFGIDVGGMSVKCGLFETDGTLLEKWTIPTNTEEKGTHILPDIAATVLAKMTEKQLTSEQVLGIGIGIPGPAKKNGEVEVAVNLHWGKTQVAEELTALSSLRTVVANDASLAALGEAWQGAAKGKKEVFLITLGTGIGGGVIINGDVVSGAHGAGGEIGHNFVNPQEQEVCNCGKRGCLEQVASATGIMRMARGKLQASELPSLLRETQVTAKDVFDAFKNKDILASEVVDEVSNYLGIALATVAGVVDPETILIGGGVSKAGEEFIDIVRSYYRKYAFTPCKNTEIKVTELGNDAGIYGGAKLILNDLLITE
ncbi:MAG: ROK family glucokinase [Lachnospiraceae bacterium]